ncbi:MAG: type II toxin-antitoxin system RelE/ParE family toxin [Chloroflexi bacterium]|nr:type II toxin-antitoxin system RelE/ParE family toxin [Chloroflexota bacterium]
MAHEIRFTQDARSHLRELSARDRRRVLDRIDASLKNEPKRETHSLKALRPNPLAGYELRIGELRVFFDVKESGDEKAVLILAVGRKKGNELRIGGKEYSL